jgi:ankyrin repeat protein
LEKGADPHFVTDEGDTLLMMAVRSGSLPLVQLLLAKGVEINAKNRTNQTALSIAEDADNTEIVELLKRAGARP